jgi:hypothetical protein
MSDDRPTPYVLDGFVELRKTLRRQLAEQTEEKTDDNSDTGPGSDLGTDQGGSSRRRSSLRRLRG